MQFIDCRDNVIMTTSLGNALIGYRMHTVSVRPIRLLFIFPEKKEQNKNSLLAQ